jgi:hypothetical protein
MRSIGYLLVAGLLLLLAGSLGQWAWQILDTRELAAYLSGRIEDARPSNAYIQQGDNWLEFQLDGNGSSVHVVSNSSVPHTAVPGDAGVWWYAFEYQLLDKGGTLLQEGVYHHRTHVTRYREASQGRLLTRNFFLDQQQVPTDGRRMIVPLNASGSPVWLRLRVRHADPALHGVMFRVYEQETFAEHKLEYRWQRLSAPKKALLARSNVYGPEHLRNEEKINLLRKRWRPLGPAGINGTDYAIRKLYVKQEAPGEVVDDAVLPYGLYVDTRTNGIIPLPEGGGTIRLQLTPTTEFNATGAGERTVVRWYGRSLGQRSETTVAISSGMAQLEADFGEGMLEVQSGHALVVRAFLSKPDGLEEITPEALHLRAYRADTRLPVVYRIDHVGEQPTPLRIDVRTVLSTDAAGTQQPVRFELLDAEGVVLSAGELHHNALPSRHDRFASIDPRRQLSEPARNYFRLPARVSRVRILAAGSSLVSAYSRPSDLVREVRYPEDLHAIGAAAQDTQPAWFMLRPANQPALLQALRGERLVLQRRPPVDDPQLLAGHYDWKEYHPEGAWRGRHLLIPRDPGLPLRDQARGAVYSELPANREVTVDLRDIEGHRQIRPTVLFQRDQEQPVAAGVLLDGAPWYETRISGRRGQLQLPALPAGPHRIRIQGPDDSRWFMNYTGLNGPAYLRRLAVAVGPDGLEFQYHKQSADREILTGQLYQAQSDRMRIHVTIEHVNSAATQPLDDWTFVQRIYDLRTADEARVPVLNTRTQTVDAGRRFFVTLGADLPAGSYRIRIRPEQDADAYLALYQLQPGQQLVRLFLREHGYVD